MDRMKNMMHSRGRGMRSRNTNNQHRGRMYQREESPPRRDAQPRTHVILITGAFGNIGTKIWSHFLRERFDRIHLILIDREADVDEKTSALDADVLLRDAERDNYVESYAFDLRKWDNEWANLFNAAHTVIHLADKNTDPNSGWEDACDSMSINFNVCRAAYESKSLHRFIYASSNHVFGGYHSEGAFFDERAGAGPISVRHTPRPGTVFKMKDGFSMDSTAYAAAKLAGEVEASCLSEGEYGLDVVIVRIGWVQPGANRPETLNVSSRFGEPIVASEEAKLSEQDKRVLRWFQLMWLSNRDCEQLFERCVFQEWPSSRARTLVMFGMSNNGGMRWSLHNQLHYQPRDDVTRHLPTLVEEWKGISESAQQPASRSRLYTSKHEKDALESAAAGIGYAAARPQLAPPERSVGLPYEAQQQRPERRSSPSPHARHQPTYSPYLQQPELAEEQQGEQGEERGQKQQTKQSQQQSSSQQQQTTQKHRIVIEQRESAASA